MCAHVIALFALWAADSSRQLQIAASIGLLISAYYYFKQLRLPVVSAIEADDNGYRLFHRGAWSAARLQQAYITAPLTVVRFKLAQGRELSLTLLPDSAPMDELRRLRIWLRWVAEPTILP